MSETFEHSPHVLIVDDDERILRLLKQFLEKNNYIVSAASSASSAIFASSLLEIASSLTPFVLFSVTPPLFALFRTLFRDVARIVAIVAHFLAPSLMRASSLLVSSWFPLPLNMFLRTLSRNVSWLIAIIAHSIA